MGSYDLEKEVEVLFSLCEDLNNASQFIDMNSIKQKRYQINAQAMLTFTNIENAAINQTLVNKFSHKETLVKLSFVILKSLYLLNWNYPNVLLNQLSYTLMSELNYINKFGNNGNWVKNDKIFKGVLCGIVGKVRPELLERVVGNIIMMLRSPNIRGQKTPYYMDRFIYHMDVAYNQILATA